MPTSCPILKLNARNRLQIKVKRQKQATTWRLTPKTAQARVKLKFQPQHTPSEPQKWISAPSILVYSFSVNLGY